MRREEHSFVSFMWVVGDSFNLHPTLAYIVCYVRLTRHLRAKVLKATRRALCRRRPTLFIILRQARVSAVPEPDLRRSTRGEMSSAILRERGKNILICEGMKVVVQSQAPCAGNEGSRCYGTAAALLWIQVSGENLPP